MNFADPIPAFARDLRAMGRAVCVVLHDVAPATWPACERLLSRIDALGRIPVTLLVVPEFHRDGPIDDSPGFVRAVEDRIARGDEIAMHGCFHWDDVPIRTPADWQRRIYTQGEGEFGALVKTAAQARLARGLASFTRLGWPVQGFVAPAWMLSAGTCAALARFPFVYTSTRRRLFALPDWRIHESTSLVWSVRTPLHRRVSRLFNRWLLHRHRDAPVLRLGLHPVDAVFPDVVEFWIGALRESLRTRTPTTKAKWLLRVREEQPPGRLPTDPERIRTP